MKCYYTAILSIFIFAISKAPAQQINLLCAENGARIVEYSSCDWEDFKAYFDADDDELEQGMYCSESGVSFPHYFTLELAVTGEISSLEFNTLVEETAYPGVSAKKIIIYARKVDDNNFSPVDTFNLRQNNAHQLFDISPFLAKQVKIEILSNFGNQQFTEIARVKGYGSFIEAMGEDSISGVWNSTFGEIAFTQTYPFVSGCFGSGQLIGQFTGRILVFQWLDETDTGFCSLIINESGEILNGYWGDAEMIAGAWSAEKLSRKIVNCPHNPLIAQLIAEGRSVLFLPNLKNAFRFDTDDFRGILSELSLFMRHHPGTRLLIEGHTDNTADASANKALSELWALKIQDLLIELGVKETRIGIQGYGESRPLASNRTLTGRIANNRIEFIIE